MNIRTLGIITAAILGAIALVMGLNVKTLLQEGRTGNWIQLDHVRGSAIRVEGKEYTLNFSQQNRLIDGLNHAESVGVEIDTEPSTIGSIVIFPFEKEPKELQVLGKHQNGLIVNASPNHFLKLGDDQGKLLDMLENAHD